MKHNNNFDIVRIIFASFVIISHASQLSLLPYPEIGLSDIGVYGFFTISGFLISKSLERSDSLMLFIKKRVFRIFPGLIVIALFTVFMLGALITTISKYEYFTNHLTYLHFLSTIFLMPVYKCLPGVFASNPKDCSVNGALWTLRYELFFYGILCLFYYISPKWRKRATISIVFVSLFGLFVWSHFLHQKFEPNINQNVTRILNLSSFFFSGVFLSYYQIIAQKNIRIWVLASLFLFSISLYFQCSTPLMNIVFPVLVISFAQFYIPQLQINPKFGDISFGIYIYGYPIQQALLQLFVFKNVYFFMLVSLVISFLMGWLSWHLVEKRFLIRTKPSL